MVKVFDGGGGGDCCEGWPPSALRILSAFGHVYHSLGFKAFIRAYCFGRRLLVRGPVRDIHSFFDSRHLTRCQ